MTRDKYDRYWTYERDELLIDLIKNRPELYDPSCAHYNDFGAKKKGWIQISECFSVKGVTGHICKDRWEQLRAQFRRSINKKKNSSENDKSRWRYEEQMTFIKPFLKERAKKMDFDNVSETSNNSIEEIANNEQVKQELDMFDLDNSTLDSDPPTKKLRLFENSSFSSVTEENPPSQVVYPEIFHNDHHQMHPMDQFFTLMATTVKKFDSRDQLNIKRQVFNMVMEIEAKYVNSESSNNKMDNKNAGNMSSSNS